MNVTLSGYVGFGCNRCGKTYNIDASVLTFKEDTSLEAEEDEYIRYTSRVDTVCDACGNDLLISFDAWEYPEAISNYSYYADVGAKEIECEFTIEHFFDDAIAKKENTLVNDRSEEERYNETPTLEDYTDQYDDTE
jgi:hypothetical protein